MLSATQGHPATHSWRAWATLALKGNPNERQGKRPENPFWNLGSTTYIWLRANRDISLISSEFIHKNWLFLRLK